MIKNLWACWQRGKNNLMAIFAPGGGHKHPLLALPQLAFSGISLTETDMDFPLHEGNRTTPQSSQALRFLQSFFDAITRIQDTGLLAVAGRLLYRQAGGESIMFAEYRQGKLIIHSASRHLNHEDKYYRQLIQAGLTVFQKLPQPVNESDIQFEILNELDDPGRQPESSIIPLPGVHKIAQGHFLAAFILGKGQKTPPWPRETDQLLHFCLQHVAIRLGEINALRALRLNVNTDPLTGVHNRRFFHEVLSREIERSNRHHQPLSLIILDIDHFEPVD